MLDLKKAMMSNLEQFYLTLQLLFVMFLLFVHNFIFNMKDAFNGYGSYIIYIYFLHTLIQFVIMLKNLNNNIEIKADFFKALIDGIFIIMFIFFYEEHALTFIPILYIYLMFQALRFPEKNYLLIPSFITLLYLLVEKGVTNTNIHIAITRNIGNILYIFFLFIILNVLSKYIYKLSRQINFMFEEINEKNSELKKMATKDYLTNMYNHRSFYSTLSEVIKKLSDKSKFSMAMFDIDNFKKVNDTYGHLTGDFILKEVSSIILETITEKDVAARYGGEEFAVLFLNKELKDSIEICENIRRKIENHLFTIDEHEIRITISCGVAETTLVNIDVCDQCKFVDHVDKMLYKAKKSGKNCVKFSC